MKTVNVTRGNQPPALVSLSSDGTIAPWVELSDREFILIKPAQVKVSVKVPEDATEGTYSGYLRILYKKTLFSLLMGS
jgi:hypothetical protein